MNMLIFGLSVSVIDILLVLIGVIILILCVSSISRRGRRESERAEPAVAAQAKDAPQAAAFQGVSPDVVAAITAAIASVWQGEQGFVVRHIKRINNAPAWNRAGREEQIYSRF